MKLALLLLAATAVPTSGAPAAVTPRDYAQIRELYARYAMAQDGGDAAALAALFAPDGTLSSAKTHHQPSAAASTSKSQMAEEGRWGWDRHFLTNIRVREEGGAVRASCVLLLLDSRPTTRFLVHGRTGIYEDRLVKTVTGWRFQDRELWMDGETAGP